METYSLSCQYLDRLQVTRGLTRQDLQNPAIFQVCGSRLGRLMQIGEWLKFSSGRFVSPEGGRELPADPLLWPDSRAREVRVAPWHHAGQPIPPSLEADVQHVLLHGATESPDRLFLEAMMVANELLQAEGMDGLAYLDSAGHRLAGACAGNAGRIGTHWEQTFSPEGPNGDTVQLLDRAEWRLRLETGQVSSLAVPPAAGEEYQSARWQFSETAGAILTWWPGALTEGAYLQHWESGSRSAVLLDCAPEALAALCLKSGLSPVQLLRSVQYEKPDNRTLLTLEAVLEATAILTLPAVRA